MRLDSYELKWIAIITMLIDHVGVIIFPEYILFRYIGRLSFPIFCFLLVEGFCYTSNLKKYIGRMFLFALISEVPYDLAFRGTHLEFEKQNVFFTLCLGLLLLYGVRQSKSWLEKILYLLVAMWFAQVIQSDYSFKGMLLIFWFYSFHDKQIIKLTGGAIWNVLWYPKIQGTGALAMLPIAAYSGKEGRKMANFFYLFYPLHLFVLYVLLRYL